MNSPFSKGFPQIAAYFIGVLVVIVILLNIYTLITT